MVAMTIVFGGCSLRFRESCSSYDYLRSALQAQRSSDFVVVHLIALTPAGSLRVMRAVDSIAEETHADANANANAATDAAAASKAADASARTLADPSGDARNTAVDVDPAAWLPMARDVLESGMPLTADACVPLLSRKNGGVFSLLSRQDADSAMLDALTRFADLPGNGGSMPSDVLAGDAFMRSCLADRMIGHLARSVPSLLANVAAPEQAFERARSCWDGGPVVLRPNAAGDRFKVQRFQALRAADVRRYAAEISPYDEHFLMQSPVEGETIRVGLLCKGGRWQALTRMSGAPPAVNVDAALDAALDATPDARSDATSDSGECATASIKSCLDEHPLASRARTAALLLAQAFRDERHCLIDFIASKTGPSGPSSSLYFVGIDASPALTEHSPFSRMLAASGMTVLDLMQIDHENGIAARAFRRQRHARIAEWVVTHD